MNWKKPYLVVSKPCENNICTWMGLLRHGWVDRTESQTDLALNYGCSHVCELELISSHLRIHNEINDVPPPDLGKANETMRIRHPSQLL